MTVVLMFGDSITQGFWDKEGGWANRLGSFLCGECLASGRENYFSSFNLGVSGNTSKDLLKRFEFETKQRLLEKEKDEDVIFIISIGVNDSLYNNKTKKNMISLGQFKKNLGQILKAARKYSDKILFLGDLPVDESKVNPLPWLPGWSYKNSIIEQYQISAEEICNKNKVPFVEIHKKFLNSDYKFLLEDGCHPNTAGHEELFNIVKKALVECGFIHT